jgi:hypothetical protein
MFKLKEYGSETEKRAVLNEIKSGLEQLPEKIEELKYMEVGLNYELDAKSFDFCLISHFVDIDGLNAYQVHPEHVKVANFIRGKRNSTCCRRLRVLVYYCLTISSFSINY